MKVEMLDREERTLVIIGRDIRVCIRRQAVAVDGSWWVIQEDGVYDCIIMHANALRAAFGLPSNPVRSETSTMEECEIDRDALGGYMRWRSFLVFTSHDMRLRISIKLNNEIKNALAKLF
ncbi:MAG: hypothetical protein Q7S63_00455 [bacterium]|nr:hypothetical protein [bacterium]